MGSYAATFALVGGTFAVVDCLAETVRGEAHHLRLGRSAGLLLCWILQSLCRLAYAFPDVEEHTSLEGIREGDWCRKDTFYMVCLDLDYCREGA